MTNPGKKRRKHDLTDKQNSFIREYLVDHNATKAAERAGYANPDKQGPRLLQNVEVRQKVQESIDEQAKRTLLNADMVVQKTLSTFEAALAAEKYSACASLLALLGKHTGAFPDKVEHGTDGGPIEIVGIEIVLTHKPRAISDDSVAS